MYNSVKSSILALAAVSTFVMTPVQAAIISYDFSVTIEPGSSSLANQTFAGSFSFNDAQIPVPGSDGEQLYSLLGFSFDFAGTLFTLNDLFYGNAARLNSVFLGLDAVTQDFQFLPATAVTDASFAFDFGNGDFDEGSITFVPRSASVPEPPIGWLLIGGLIALAGLSRGTRGLHESV